MQGRGRLTLPHLLRFVVYGVLHAWISVEEGEWSLNCRPRMWAVQTPTHVQSSCFFVGKMGILGEGVAHKADHLKHNSTIMALSL